LQLPDPFPTKSDKLPWFVIGVKPRHEKSVSSILQYKGYETFLPLYKKQHRYLKRERAFSVPLFPGYVFCRLDLHSRYLSMLMTPGVIQILGFGRTPAPVLEGEITSLQVALNNELRIEPHPFVEAGEKVRVTQGPLMGMEGIVIRARNPLRIVISVSLLMRSVQVEVNSSMLAHRSDALAQFRIADGLTHQDDSQA
jgi:transcription antitermination factor NusG